MTEWRWVSKAAVLASHDAMLAAYGGYDGILDMGALEGALSRPHNLAVYAVPEPDVADLAAMYAIGIAKAHAFLDGNKRTAWTTCRAFLRLNGYRLDFKDTVVVLLMVDVAKGKVDENAFASWIRSGLRPIA